MATSSIYSVAQKCSMILHPPEIYDNYNMFYSDLEQNCIDYYSVKINKTILETIEQEYNACVIAAQEYKTAYEQNERLLYYVKTWMSMIIADPLTGAQQEIKECNSLLLATSFNLDDMQNTLPIFLKSQRYVSECFSQAQRRMQSIKTDIGLSCTDNINQTNGAAQELTDKYHILLLQQNKINDLKQVLKQHIIDMNPPAD
jgi:hypothetical protein